MYIVIQEEDVEITKEIAKKATKQLKKGDLIKCALDILIKCLTHMYNRCIYREEKWKMTSTYKKTDMKQSSNYREFSATSITSKIYGRILRVLVRSNMKTKKGKNN